MARHDHSYKLIFSHPDMVRDLLVGFVREDWLTQLDYASLEKVNGRYVSDDLLRRSDDVVWRVRCGEGWLYLLIEFQSRAERYMAVRILTYMGLLYQDLIKAAQLRDSGLLPRVLPIVLYNGATRWYAETEIESLIERDSPASDACGPQLRYLLIDEGAYPDCELATLPNLAAALFRLENARTPREIGERLVLLLKNLRSPQQRHLRRAFIVWVDTVILPRFPGVPINVNADLTESPAMLAERIEEWKAQWWREALDEGRQEGRKEGRLEGEAGLMVRLLQQRFGELPADVVQRIQRAEREELTLWSERLFKAEDLHSVFEYRD